MLGAISGDIIGSVYEWNNIQTTDFDYFSKDLFFTDDSVLTIATADCILNNKDFKETYIQYYKNIPSNIKNLVLNLLDEDMKKVIFDFYKCYMYDIGN